MCVLAWCVGFAFFADLAQWSFFFFFPFFSVFENQKNESDRSPPRTDRQGGTPTKKYLGSIRIRWYYDTHRKHITMHNIQQGKKKKSIDRHFVIQQACRSFVSLYILLPQHGKQAGLVSRYEKQASIFRETKEELRGNPSLWVFTVGA